MSRRSFWLWIGSVLVTLVIVASVGEAQQTGGAFLPTFNYVISGQWTWSTLTPWIVQSGNPATNKYTITFATPTAARTLTIPNATGAVMVGSTSGNVATTVNGIRAGQFEFSGSNPSSVTTGLTTIAGCTVSPMTNASPNTKYYTFSVIFTSVAGRLDVFEWTSGAGAGNTNVALSYVCAGTV